MLAVPSLRLSLHSNSCTMPGIPAMPKKSAYSDQPKAASVPRLTRVSMVVVPWRRLVQAARWNGHAPQTTTGAARVNESHCQLVNCRAETIAMATTGTVSTAEIISRCRNSRVGSAACPSSAPPSASG